MTQTHAEAPQKKHKAATFYTTDFYAMLKAGLPDEYTTEHDILDVPRLAVALQCRSATVYRWLNSNSMGLKSARKLAEISTNAKIAKKDMLTVEKLLPYCGV